MKSLWNDAEAAQFTGPLGARVYTSRLLGRDKSLVLHGGGNTSLKSVEKNVFGEDEDVLYVKGSGQDLETIGPDGFAPVALAPLKRIAALPALSDTQLMNELGTRVLRAGAPPPSVETLLHAILPHRYVDHTHADAILAICNTADGEQRIRDLYADEVVVVPYVMAGFDLAARCASEWPRQSRESTIGMVLVSHGVLSFGADARESYERMIRLVTKAEEYLAARNAWVISLPPAVAAPLPREEIARLRREIAEAAGFPVVLKVSQSPRLAGFARHADVARLAKHAVATPDHVIYTKPGPMLGRDIAAFARDYSSYFERHAPQAKEPKRMLDPAPRVILDPGFGCAAAGRTAKESAIAEELYEHTVDVILRAEALGGWRALPEKHLFDVEYWDLEQAKLKKDHGAPPFTGEIALVTGAASGIGKACVESFLRRGAAVIALDLNPAVASQWKRADVLGLQCDLTIAGEVRDCLDRATCRFGGVDMLVLNAGIFPASAAIQDIASEAWRSAMTVNVEASLHVLQACHPLLALAPQKGRVVVIGSRNVTAPGPGAAAYSASKAALTQLARVAALEWAKEGIRVNSIHPDAVYDTALWTDALLAKRAAAYDMTVEQYRKKNLLHTEVSSKDVAELAAEMCGPLFAKTTAAQIPVDGGNERVV